MSKFVFFRPTIFLACTTLIGCGDESGRQFEKKLAELSRPVVLTLLDSPCPLERRDHQNYIYLIAPRDCTASGSTFLTMGVFDNGEVTRYSFTFADWNTTRVVNFGKGGVREIALLKSGTWREIPNNNSWAPRDGAGLLVKDGRAFLLSGWQHGPTPPEVWVSDNLVEWEFLGLAPWTGRHGAAWLVHDNRLYVIGGDLLTDVWSSADGVEWRLETANAPFGRRYSPNAVSLDGRIILYAGLHWLPDEFCGVEGHQPCEVEGFNDAWQSSDGGRTWERILDAAPWAPRGLIHGSIVHDGNIYLIGGGLKNVIWPHRYADTVAEFTDIWSSPDGIQWTYRGDFTFPGRTHFSVAQTSFGCVVSDGSVGNQEFVSNNLYIAEDCLNFTEVPDPPHQPRHASSVAEFMGTLVILGGPPIGDAGATIWQYIP